MAKGKPKASGSIREVAQLDRDAVSFFRRANMLAADPRVKFIFGHAANEYERAASLVGPVAGKVSAKAPAVFPVEKFESVECYVCGYEIEGDELPEMCPSCGAARYAFEREISQESAWELVAKTTRDVQTFAKKAGAIVKGAKGKDALTKAAGVRKALLDEAKEERARIHAGP